MTDYLSVEVRLKAASNPEMDPLVDHVAHTMEAQAANGYAYSDRTHVIAEADAIALDFSPFDLDKWLWVMVINLDSANDCDVTLSDESADFTIPLPADGCLVLRHYRAAQPGSPQIASTLGATVRVVCAGEPYVTPT